MRYGVHMGQMSRQRDLHGELDWGSASVEGRRLTVGFAAEPASDWTDRLEAVIDRLQRPGSPWGPVKVKPKRVRVAEVVPGCEDDLRHFLEGAVLQANTDFAPDDEQDGGDGRSRSDAAMTAAFRSYAEQSDESPGEHDV